MNNTLVLKYQSADCLPLNGSCLLEDDVHEFNSLLGADAREISRVMNYIVICTIIAVFGIVTNVINMRVFSKQGYDNTMNISLSGIAISDLCTLVSMIWFAICANPMFDNVHTYVAFSEIMYLTAAWPHCLFARITCIITVFITLERCLCVSIPLKIKNVITKSRTTVIVSLLFLSQLLSSIPTYYTTYIDWKFFPNKNRSMMGLHRIKSREHVDTISYFLQAVMQAGSFILLILFTLALLINLNRQTKWREASTSSDSRKEAISTREKKLVRMVFLIALILIICFTPGLICFTAMALEPELIVGGRYDNLFWVVWSFPFMFQTVNSSVNIFVYYTMSSKYRDTFNEMFVRCRKLVNVTKKTQCDQ